MTAFSTSDNSKRILIVDDDLSIRSGMSDLLSLSGYIVQSASNTTAAQQMLDHEVFDLVITDILMPGESGLSLILELRRYGDAPKIIAISGGGKTKGSGLLKIAQKYGANRILQKPISTKTLLMEIKAVFEADDMNRET